MRLHTLAAVAAVIALASFATADQGDQVAREFKGLKGSWTGISGEEAGQKASADDAKQMKLVFDGDRFTASAGGYVLMQGKVRVDPTRKPKTIDLVSDGPRLKSQTGPGIYERDGDTLRLHLVQPGEDRPKDFTATGKPGQHLMVYKRDK